MRIELKAAQIIKGFEGVELYGFQGPSYNSITNKHLTWVEAEHVTDHGDGTFTIPDEILKKKYLVKK